MKKIFNAKILDDNYSSYKIIMIPLKTIRRIEIFYDGNNCFEMLEIIYRNEDTYQIYSKDIDAATDLIKAFESYINNEESEVK